MHSPGSIRARLASLAPMCHLSPQQHEPGAGQQQPSACYLAALEAVEADDLQGLRDILTADDLSGASSLDRDYLGGLLHKACERSSPRSLLIGRLLIERNCNINFTTNEQGASCLMMAAKSNQARLVELLLDAGAVKVNAVDRYLWTALTYASYFGAFECARMLIERGAYVNLTDCDKMSCLSWAAGRGHVHVVELLIAHGAFVNALDRYNNSALVWACRKGNSQVAELLIQNGAKIDERGMYSWTPLLAAVAGNHIETVRLLVNSGASLQVRDSQGMSPLQVTCKDACVELAVELIKLGAPVNLCDGQANTPLIHATQMKCGQLVKALLEAGAHHEQPGKDQRNAVHWAAINNDPDLCRLFLAKGVDCNLADHAGETYLMLAARHRSWEVIQLLIEYNTPSPPPAPAERDQASGRNQTLIGLLLSKSTGKCEPQLPWSNQHSNKSSHPIE